MKKQKNNTPPTTDYNNPPTQKDLDKVNYLMGAVILVLFVALVGAFFSVFAILLDAWHFKSDTFQNLVNQISQQNTKLDSLEKEIKNIKVIKQK